MTRRVSATLAVVATAVVCFGAGAATVYWFMRPPAASAPPAATPSSPSAAPPAAATSGPLPDVVIPIADDVARRAGIEVTTVSRGSVSDRVRLPGTVTPNQYQQVVVSAVTGGRITRVPAQLGDRVRRGTPLAEIYSSELSDAETRYLAARADLVAADERLNRTTRLVAIGAASQQELEQTQAERTKLANELEGAAARLRLLGLSSSAIAALKSAKDIAASITVTAPADGIVTERNANTGIVVAESAPLFTISSLSPVWVIADVHERDLARVRVGAPAVVTAEGEPPFTGKVAYISPDLRGETRTAQVRIEAPNPGGRMRFGMFVSVELASGSSAGGAVVPAAAVQQVAGRSFVYVQDALRPGTFIEREVTAGARVNGNVEILHGVQPGDVVVSAGSFFVRAEGERLGLRSAARDSVTAGAQGAAAARTVRVQVTETGFTPASVEVAAGSRLTIEFLRETDKTCATEILVPARKIRQPLPLNQVTRVDLGVVSGEVAFSCGMNMLKGTVVVR